MRVAPRLLSIAVVLTAACAPPDALRSAVAPRAVPVAAEAEAAPAPDARPVLQVIPPADAVQWGGADAALTVTGRRCETSIVDAEGARVTARIAACRVWPSPTRDVFLAQMDDGSLVTWDASGARGAWLTSTYPFDQSPAWSPDGARVAMFREGVVRLDVIGAETASRVVVLPTEAGDTPGAMRGEVSWRADGALVAVHDYRHVWTLATEDVPPRMLATRCAGIRQARFAPRGDVLTVWCNGERSETWDTRTGALLEAMPYVHDENTARLPPMPGLADVRWSADERYVSARRLDPASPALVVLAAGSWKEVWRREGAAQGAWSTSGARLAVTSEAGGLEVLDASTAQTRPLPRATTAWFERLYQAPDGALMAPMVPRADGKCQAVRIAPGDGASSVVDLPTEALQPWWSPDGSRMLVRTMSWPNMMMASWRLFVEDLTTKSRTFLDHGNGGFEVHWSARGHRLLVVSRDALLFDTDTHQVWKVPVEEPVASALDADGGRAALETPAGLQLVTLASKEAPVLLRPRSDPPPVLLALSGSRLAAVTREGEVSVWNVETRALVASWNAGFAPDHVAWLGAAGRLALSRREVLRLADADGSNAMTVTALRSGAATGLILER